MSNTNDQQQHQKQHQQHQQEIQSDALEVLGKERINIESRLKTAKLQLVCHHQQQQLHQQHHHHRCHHHRHIFQVVDDDEVRRMQLQLDADIHNTYDQLSSTAWTKTWAAGVSVCS